MGILFAAIMILAGECSRAVANEPLQATSTALQADESQGLAATPDMLATGRLLREAHLSRSADECRNVKHGEDLTQALFAAFRLWSENENEDSVVACRMAGFIEGRLRVDVPRFWVVELGLARSEERARSSPSPLSREERQRRIYGALGGREKLYPEEAFHIGSVLTLPSESHLMPPPGVDLLLENKHIVMRRGERVLSRVPVVEAERWGNWGSSIFVYVHERDSYVAFTRAHGSPYVLLKLHPDGTIVWRTVVWGVGGDPRAFSSGPLTHYVHLTVDDSQVILFGVGRGQCYLEMFDEESGKPLLRFASNNWNADVTHRSREGPDKKYYDRLKSLAPATRQSSATTP